MHYKSRRTVITKGGGVGIRRLVKVGNGVCVVLPREFLRDKKLSAGHEVALRWSDESLSIHPLKEID